jgi:hypothetical protein
MTFTVEQFLAACHLGVAAILNLEPRSALGFGHVWAEAVLGHNPFQIHLAHPAEIAPYRVRVHDQRIA